MRTTNNEAVEVSWCHVFRRSAAHAALHGYALLNSPEAPQVERHSCPKGCASARFSISPAEGLVPDGYSEVGRVVVFEIAELWTMDLKDTAKQIRQILLLLQEGGSEVDIRPMAHL